MSKTQKFTEEYFRRRLTADEYHILRQKGTEPPFSGKYLYLDEDGVYCCRACGQKLFLSQHKFHSASGWPSFYKAIKNSVEICLDFSHFMIRNEVICNRCRSHLGHLFHDGYRTTDLRYCINSLALQFKKRH